MKIRDNRGFTLIELLVVIGIIGILTGVIVPNFMGVRERARDVQRKSDLQQLQKALEMYKTRTVPPAYLANFSSLTCGASWVVSSVTYMSKFPCDPLNNTTKYSYTLGASPLTYTLQTCLENRSDPDGGTDCTTANGGLGISFKVTEP